MYLYILLLNQARRFMGFLNTMTAMAFIGISGYVRKLSDKQIERINYARDKAVDKAKAAAIMAAQRVIALEANVSVVEQKAAEKAFKQTVKMEKLK